MGLGPRYPFYLSPAVGLVVEVKGHWRYGGALFVFLRDESPGAIASEVLSGCVERAVRLTGLECQITWKPWKIQVGCYFRPSQDDAFGGYGCTVGLGWPLSMSSVLIRVGRRWAWKLGGLP